jgi:hypothetical protein
MNNRSDVPGYGYPLVHGATTLMEDWQAIQSLGNNHCMLGHLLGWFYSGLGGIRAAKDAIAFNKIEIHPQVVGDISYTKGHVSVALWFNKKSEWQKKKNTFELNVVIPVNTTADIYLPLKAGAIVFKNCQPIKADRVLHTGSGNYKFIVRSAETE